MTALKKLIEANNYGKFICVGLDTDIQKIPKPLQKEKNPILEFNRLIIEATKDEAAAYKINLAFYEKDGIEGLKKLEETLSFIPSECLTIADGKRGDIANTSRMYAESIFNHFKFDSTTLNPLMGKDSLSPFLELEDKLNFILALTSNPGSKDFQKLELKDGLFLFQKIIENVLQWNDKLNCGIVFGATNINELKSNLELIKDLPLLIPGVGAQGGSVKEVAGLLFSSNKNNFLINVSRGIIYKSSGDDFDAAAANELNSLNRLIADSRN